MPFFLDASIVEDDLNRLVQIFNEGRYTPVVTGSDSDNEDIPSKEEFEKLRKMFKLATHALKVYSDDLVYWWYFISLKKGFCYFEYIKWNFNLKSRDSELTEAIEEMAANPPSSEMQEIVKELEDEKEKLKKENKDLKNQIKKFKRAKTGQGAIEVISISST